MSEMIIDWRGPLSMHPISMGCMMAGFGKDRSTVHSGLAALGLTEQEVLNSYGDDAAILEMSRRLAEGIATSAPRSAIAQVLRDDDTTSDAVSMEMCRDRGLWVGAVLNLARLVGGWLGVIDATGAPVVAVTYGEDAARGATGHAGDAKRLHLMLALDDEGDLLWTTSGIRGVRLASSTLRMAAAGRPLDDVVHVPRLIGRNLKVKRFGIEAPTGTTDEGADDVIVVSGVPDERVMDVKWIPGCRPTT